MMYIILFAIKTHKLRYSVIISKLKSKSHDQFIWFVRSGLFLTFPAYCPCGSDGNQPIGNYPLMICTCRGGSLFANSLGSLSALTLPKFSPI